MMSPSVIISLLIAQPTESKCFPSNSRRSITLVKSNHSVDLFSSAVRRRNVMIYFASSSSLKININPKASVTDMTHMRESFFLQEDYRVKGGNAASWMYLDRSSNLIRLMVTNVVGSVCTIGDNKIKLTNIL